MGVGKGRDVGLNQIALFEGKVAGGNGEQVLSRDVYRIGQLFDFFRMLSFFFTTVGYYVCTMMTVLTVYIFLYGRAYLAFSGVDRGIARVAALGNTSLNAVLNAQFLVQTLRGRILETILSLRFFSISIWYCLQAPPHRERHIPCDLWLLVGCASWNCYDI